MDRRKIFQLAANLIKKCGSNDPLEIAQELGIIIIPKNFEDLLGMYLHIERNRFIFINQNLSGSLLREVVAHEIGHDQLHRHLAKEGMHEFRIYHMKDNTEYEANIFSAHLLLDNDEIYNQFRSGYDIVQVAAMNDVDINLILIKAEEMRYLGYNLNESALRADGHFLKDLKCN